MTHADFVHGGGFDHHAVAANEAEKAEHDLVAARSVMRIEKHDFGDFLPHFAEAAEVIMTKAQDVFRKVRLAFGAAARLPGHDGLKAVLHQGGDDFRGREEAVFLAHGVPRGFSENAGGFGANSVEGKNVVHDEILFIKAL